MTENTSRKLIDFLRLFREKLNNLKEKVFSRNYMVKITNDINDELNANPEEKSVINRVVYGMDNVFVTGQQDSLSPDSMQPISISNGNLIEGDEATQESNNVVPFSVDTQASMDDGVGAGYQRTKRASAFNSTSANSSDKAA